MSHINLKQQIEAFNKGIILDSDGESSECFNFFDWFCRDTSLENKAKKLFTQVKQFVKANPKLDTTKVYVFFKNNCPVNGQLYDDFRICDIESGDVLYTVIPEEKYAVTKWDEKCVIWGKENNFEGPIRKGVSLREVLKTEVVS